MFKLLSLIIVLLASLPTGGTAFTVEDPAKIHMVVWRGCESACEGFRRFFYDRDLPVKITVTNVGKDKSKLIKIRETLIAEKPDLVVTWGTSVSVGIIGTIKEFGSNTALGDIPVLFMIVADPVRSNIVESYTSYGRDFVTGVRNRVREKTQIGLILQYFKPKKIGVINNSIWQFPFKNTEEVIYKANRYSSLGVKKLQDKGINGSVLKGFLHGIWSFIKHYFFKLGFLDGGAGLVIAFGNFEGTFYRYIKLTEAQSDWPSPKVNKIQKIDK